MVRKTNQNSKISLILFVICLLIFQSFLSNFGNFDNGIIKAEETLLTENNSILITLESSNYDLEYNDGLICYSQGNYIFDLWPEATKKTILLKVNVSKGYKISYTTIPICINDEYQPAVAEGQLKSSINNNLVLYSQGILKSAAVEIDAISLSEKKRIVNNFRNSQYIYFLNNFFRYSIMMIFQSVTRTLYRRIF